MEDHAGDVQSGDKQGESMRAVIIANGQFPRKEYPRYLLASADILVCCDGALVTLEKQGIVPYAVVGDMDSVCHRALKRFNGVVVDDRDQDTNDLTKAFNYLTENFPDVEELHILGATGRSEAHTLGNMSLLMEYQQRCPQIRMDMVSDYSTILAVTDTETLFVGQGRRVSVFSPDTSLKICSEGLKWPLDNVVFDNWWKATLNLANSDSITLRFSHKSMALIVLD